MANLLESLICVLFDFSYERNLYEALMFYFFYSLFEGYFVIGVCFSMPDHPNLDLVSLLPIIPFLFCVTFSVCFLFKKNLKDLSSIFLVLSSMFLTIIFPNIVGFIIGLIPVTILSTMDDNSPAPSDSSEFPQNTGKQEPPEWPKSREH